MKTLNFSTTIEASKETVWKVLFTDENYWKWAEVFCEGSNAKTDWKKGSRVEFTTPNGDGMFSNIEEKVENELMVFRHLGMLKDGKEVEDVEASKNWNNAKESYELVENNGKTELKVAMDSNEEYSDYFKETFPKALKRIKELSEQS